MVRYWNLRQVMCERWKKIPGYEDLYQVSDLGRVKSFISWNGTNTRILKPGQDTHGYFAVNLYRRKKVKFTYIHQLVLKAFIGPCPDGMECRHLNDNKKDNRLINLAYGTRSDNLLDRTRNGISNSGDHKGIKNHMAKLTNNSIIRIKKLLNNGILTQEEIGHRFGVTGSLISMINTGKRWKHV